MTSKLSDWLGTSIVACVDIEATCCNKDSFPRSEMEIIEIGITLLDTTVEPYAIMDSKSWVVRPIIHPTLTDFCTELTSITQDEVDSADDWSVIAPEIAGYFASHKVNTPIVWASWGDFDANKIARECVAKVVGNPMPTPHFNLKRTEAKWRNSSKEHGLGGTMKTLGLEFVGRAHRAGVDALAVAMVLQTIGPGIVRSKV